MQVAKKIPRRNLVEAMKKKKKCDTNCPKHWSRSIVDRDELNGQLASRVNCGTFSAFDLFGTGFAFPFGVFDHCIASTS